MEEILTTLNNSDVYIALPPNFDTGKRYPVVMAIHGSGREARSYRSEKDDPKGSDFYAHQRDLSIQNGFLFCVISNGQNTWGKEEGSNNLLSLYEFVTQNYFVEEAWVLWAASAGGTLMHQMVRRHPQKVLRCIGTFPVYDLEVEFDILQSCRDVWISKQAINDADANPAKWYPALTKTPYLIFHGKDDSAVPIAENSLKLKRDVNRLGGDVVVIAVSGGHSTTNYEVYNDPTISNYLQGGSVNTQARWEKTPEFVLKHNGELVKVSDALIKVDGLWRKAREVLIKTEHI